MNATIGKPKTQQPVEPKDEHSLVLTEALSCAVEVAENGSFDQNVCIKNRPGGERLRMEMEQRWNYLIMASSSATNSSQNGVNVTKNGDNLPTPETSALWLSKIYDKHTESGRHYHTVVHLWELFELLDMVIEHLNAPKWYVPMAWSVFFHDSIYDPKSNRNEKDSAELFRAFVNDCMSTIMSKSTFDSALSMILATEKHKVIVPSDTSRAISQTDELEEILMQKHFLDLDMAVLGKQKDAYMKYAALIRQEYEFVPSDVYCSKRAEILETFLVGNPGKDEKKTIYLTDSFRGAFEERARENLRNEIELLRKNIIPG